MGANLVERGFAITGFDLDPERVERFVGVGGHGASSVAEVGEWADVVVLSLPSEVAFHAVAVSPGGLAKGDLRDTTVVETSTLPLAVKDAGRAALEAHGATLLDCPLSGTGDQAMSRDLVVMASGKRSAVERCRPIFEGFARAHHYVGEFGAGTKMKFVANLLVAIHNVAAAEALLLAGRAGLDLEQMLEVVGDGAGASRMLEVRGPKMIRRTYAGGIRTDVFKKDLVAISEFAAAHGAPVALLALCQQLYVAVEAAGYGAADTAAVYEVLAHMSDPADRQEGG